MAEREPHAVIEIVDDAGAVLDAVATDGTADLGVVDAIAQLQLAARRRGLAVRVREVGPVLRGLLELTGVTGVVGCGPVRPRRVSVPRLPMSRPTPFRR